MFNTKNYKFSALLLSLSLLLGLAVAGCSDSDRDGKKEADTKHKVVIDFSKLTLPETKVDLDKVSVGLVMVESGTSYTEEDIVDITEKIENEKYTAECKAGTYTLGLVFADNAAKECLALVEKEVTVGSSDVTVTLAQDELVTSKVTFDFSSLTIIGEDDHIYAGYSWEEEGRDITEEIGDDGKYTMVYPVEDGDQSFWFEIQDENGNILYTGEMDVTVEGDTTATLEDADFSNEMNVTVTFSEDAWATLTDDAVVAEWGTDNFANIEESADGLKYFETKIPYSSVESDETIVLYKDADHTLTCNMGVKLEQFLAQPENSLVVVDADNMVENE